MPIQISCNKCKRILMDYETNENQNVAEDGRYLCDRCYEKENDTNDKKVMDKFLKRY